MLSYKSNSNLSKARWKSSVVAEMSHLLLLHLLFQICASAKQSGFEGLDERMYKSENTVNEREEGLMQRMERMEISWKQEKAHLETKLESQNMEMENNKKRLTEM